MYLCMCVFVYVSTLKQKRLNVSWPNLVDGQVLVTHCIWDQNVKCQGHTVNKCNVAIFVATNKLQQTRSPEGAAVTVECSRGDRGNMKHFFTHWYFLSNISAILILSYLLKDMTMPDITCIYGNHILNIKLKKSFFMTEEKFHFAPASGAKWNTNRGKMKCL